MRSRWLFVSFAGSLLILAGCGTVQRVTGRIPGGSKISAASHNQAVSQYKALLRSGDEKRSRGDFDGAKADYLKAEGVAPPSYKRYAREKYDAAVAAEPHYKAKQAKKKAQQAERAKNAAELKQLMEKSNEYEAEGDRLAKSSSHKDLSRAAECYRKAAECCRNGLPQSRKHSYKHSSMLNDEIKRLERQAKDVDERAKAKRDAAEVKRLFTAGQLAYDKGEYQKAVDLLRKAHRIDSTRGGKVAQLLTWAVTFRDMKVYVLKKKKQLTAQLKANPVSEKNWDQYWKALKDLTSKASMLKGKSVYKDVLALKDRTREAVHRVQLSISKKAELQRKYYRAYSHASMGRETASKNDHAKIDARIKMLAPKAAEVCYKRAKDLPGYRAHEAQHWLNEAFAAVPNHKPSKALLPSVKKRLFEEAPSQIGTVYLSQLSDGYLPYITLSNATGAPVKCDGEVVIELVFGDPTIAEQHRQTTSIFFDRSRHTVRAGDFRVMEVGRGALAHKKLLCLVQKIPYSNIQSLRSGANLGDANQRAMIRRGEYRRAELRAYVTFKVPYGPSLKADTRVASPR